jgi:hypothetical protein
MPSVKEKITAESEKAFSKLPPMIQGQVKSEFSKNQSEYSDIVTHSFSIGMHNIFLIVAAIMTTATITVSFITEKPLRTSKISDAPGVM